MNERKINASITRMDNNLYINVKTILNGNLGVMITYPITFMQFESHGCNPREIAEIEDIRKKALKVFYVFEEALWDAAEESTPDFE